MAVIGVHVRVQLVAIALVIGVLGVWGEYTEPFFDPDCFSTDCSWSWDRLFSIECFCGLKPGISYRVTVRTLPVDDTPNDPDDTKVEIPYIPSDCGQPDKTQDVRCQTSAEARWSPECFHVTQKASSGEYDIVEIIFGVAPVSYNFNRYGLYIYEYAPDSPLGRPEDSEFLYMSSVADRNCSSSYEPTLQHRFNITGWSGSLETDFVAVVQPRPTSQKQCLNVEGEEISCKRTYSSPFHLIANPCKGNPCGEAAIGQCIPNQKIYTCNCTAGYMAWNQTCLVDPCMVLAANEKDSMHQCENGVCQYTKKRMDYYCTCYDGFEYQETQKKCVEKTSIGKIVGIVVASCLAGLILFVLVVFVIRQRRHPPEILTKPESQDGHIEEVRRRSRRVLPIYSDDHPKHKAVIQCFCRFLEAHCRCDVSLVDWQTSVAPTITMWLDSEIERADIVLLLCSKGTGKKYKDKARQKATRSSDGVYGDVFVQALTLLEAHFNRDGACEKFVVCFFDYSSEEDIPAPFRCFAKYRLMKCMETLFLRIHNKVKDSPRSKRHVPDLEEFAYPNLQMGKPLHDAIEAMKEVIKREPKWYHNNNNGKGTRKVLLESPRPSLSQQPLLTSISPQISMDSAYDSNNFFKDTASCGGSSNGSVFEKMFEQLDSFPVKRQVDDGTLPDGCHALQMQGHPDDKRDQPVTRFFSDDMHITMNQASQDYLSSDFYSDVQMADIDKKDDRAFTFV
ncbi:uncharacterized protein LOC110982087 isoform X2 [Acanthaster planci]|uniref:Uncharacterized protein LOC110982087 isoform X2 n=1 Tax=Acanthaster planci TaxID=133434 RepID=A0A8B7YTA8_ACAPL|nr:uncharacterized protein LOC110982087 isoform X2 [Acanthaster planci]